MELMRWERELPEMMIKDPEGLRELGKQVSITSTQDSEIVIDHTRSAGPFVWDIFGKRYFDFSSSVGVMNLGHGVPEITRALMRQIPKLVQMPHLDWPNAISIWLSKRLCDITPGRFPKKVLLKNDGTGAVEAAIKMLLAARPERPAFVAFPGAFHGRTGYSLALHGSKAINREHFPRSLLVYPHIPFPGEGVDCGLFLNEFRKLPLESVNGVFIELIQGEGGINVADPRIVKELSAFLKVRGIKLVVDEVQTGFYRTGKMFVCEHYDIEPDIICLSKSLGGGLAVGAAVARAELDFDKPGRDSSTFPGGALAAASALTVLELMENLDQKLLEENIRILSEFAPEGLGLMRRWRFETPALRGAFVDEAKMKGILLLGAGKSNVRFMPQVNMPTELLEEALAILRSIDIPHL